MKNTFTNAYGAIWAVYQCDGKTPLSITPTCEAEVDFWLACGYVVHCIGAM